MPDSVISIIKIVLAVITIVFSASLSYDLPIGETSIPITGQSLAVLCWAVFMKPSESFIALAIYIALGIFGLGVFAGGASGMEVIQGVSGGYIVGFLIAAVVVSWIRDPYRKETIFSLLLLMILGTAIIMISGLIRMSLIIGVEKSLAEGFWPFWQGAVAKILIGAIICYIVHLIVRAVYKPKR